MRKADNLPPSCAAVTKSGSLNFLEPSGPVQACNGTALPFTGDVGTRRPVTDIVQLKILVYWAAVQLCICVRLDTNTLCSIWLNLCINMTRFVIL